MTFPLVTYLLTSAIPLKNVYVSDISEYVAKGNFLEFHGTNPFYNSVLIIQMTMLSMMKQKDVRTMVE